MNLRNVAVATALAAAAAMTWYWSRQPPPAPASAAAEAAPPGFWLENARLLGTAEDGRIAYTITAQRAEELPGEDRLELIGVSIEYRPESDVSWLVSAARATAPKSGERLELTGGVRLVNDPGNGRPPIVITASEISLSPSDHVAEAPGPIEFSIGDDVLRAVGLRADLKRDDLRLESDGHGRFLP